jgi:hypothetical protein
MKRVLIGIFFSLFIIVLSCDEKLLLIKCADCIETEPVEATLQVKLDDYIGGIPVSSEVRIYQGNIEDSILFGRYSVNYNLFEQTVPINEKYTVSATYNNGKATYIAIDSATPRVRYDTQQCDNPCYYVYDNKVNLRIKYTK